MPKKVVYVLFWILFCFVEVICISGGARNRPVIKDHTNLTCEYFYQETNDVWLMGEVAAKSPFAAQLSAVYSFVPISFVLISHLVVGDLSVSIPTKLDPKTHQVLEWTPSTRPFSEFFDLPKFTAYFKKHRLHIINQTVYDHCFTTQKMRNDQRYHHKVIELKRIPEFLPYHRKDFHLMLTMINFSNLHRDKLYFPVQSHQQIRIRSPYKMTAFYNFWSDSVMLGYVLKALHPSPSIHQAVLNILENQLPKEFVTMHLRLDEEGVQSYLDIDDNHDNNSINSNRTVQTNTTNTRNTLLIEKLLYSIQKTENYQKYLHLPIYLFLSTAIINDTNSVDRLLLFLLHYSKLTPHRLIFLSPNLGQFSGLLQSPVLTEANVLLKSITLLPLLQWTPEHVQYIDLLLSRRSLWFIPSPIASWTSYLSLRLRHFSQDRGRRGGGYGSYSNITEDSVYGNNFIYRDWGL